MIDNDFAQINIEAEKLSRLIKKALDNYKRKGFENKKIYNELELRYSENINDLVDCISYFQKEVKEFTLKLRSDGRYETNDESYYFTSGSKIEVYVDDEIGWCIGRIECRHDNGKPIYYFLNDDDKNIDLYEGMKIRIRY